jgi:pilus assembly protein FimV
MLVALYRANEGAFINKNMNLVRAGRVLTIPDRAAAESVAAPDANKVVLAQAQDFNEYRAKLGQTVASAPPREEPPQQRAAGRITAKPDETAAAPKAAPKDELRISKADAAKGGKAAATARADDTAARERAAKEANERVVALEKNVQDLQKLLELKNQQLADLQKQAQAAKAAPPPIAAKAPEPAKAAPEPKPEAAPAPTIAKAEPPKAEAPKAEPVKPEAPKPEAMAAAPVVAPPPPVEAPMAAPPPDAPKAEAPKPEAPKAAVTKKPAPPSPPPEPSFVDMLLDEPLYLAGGGGGILALLIGGYLWRKKRSAKLENSLLGVTTTDSSSVFGTTGGRSVDTGGSSLQTDFSQSGIGAIDTDEVDPVAEADVYMAYGRDAQAEEILKEALQKDPNRQAVRVKLLEIYAARKDLKAFETTAGELYAASGGQGPDWAKAVELGQQVDPANPMYGGRPGTSPERSQPTVVIPAVAAAASDLPLDLAAKAPPSIDFDLDAGTRGGAAAAPDLALDVASQAPADLGFDLNLDGDTQQPADEASDFSPSGTFIMDAATKKAVSDMVESQGDAGALSIDFELPGTKPAGSPASFDATAKMMAQSQPTNVVDFDFKPEAPKSPGTSQGVDLSAISFDLGTPAGADGAPVNSGWQEVATKLDLAKAYQEMGDKDGARELLNEVLKEGDAAQQQQANTMLAALR